MKPLRYISIFALLLILISSLTLKLHYGYDLPAYSGSRIITGIQDTVEIYTDPYGVPHIFGKNEKDLFFSAGYIIARERLFQLSLLAAIARGELSAILGSDYKEHDNYIKQNDLFAKTGIIPENIDSKYATMLEAYCSGINAWIDDTAGELPPSFKILNAKPVKWTSSDVITAVTIMTSRQKGARQIDWFLNAMRQYFDETRLLEILPVDLYEHANSDASIEEQKGTIDIEIENEIWSLLGATGSLLQSEAIILPKGQNALNKPIFVFSDIWGIQQPTKWYDMHLVGSNINVEGAFIPGFPIPLVGKNVRAVWAITGPANAATINALFDLAYQAPEQWNFDNTDTALCYIDTSTFYQKQNGTSRRLMLIEEKLAGADRINIDDVIHELSNMQNSTKAGTAQMIAEIYRENKQPGKIVDLLYSWDGGETVQSVETTLINIIYTKLLENIFMDELSLVGEDVLQAFKMIPDLAEQSVNRILANPKATWIDDIRTVTHQEDLTEIIVKSVDEALAEIEQNFGENTIMWQWGKINTKTYNHILSGRFIRAKLYNMDIGPIEGSGSNSNLNVSEYFFNNSYDQISGISINRIFDLSEMDLSYSILPTGQSGLPGSNHYADQMELFNDHSFRKIEFDESIIRNSDQYQKLLLLPTQ